MTYRPREGDRVEVWAGAFLNANDAVRPRLGDPFMRATVQRVERERAFVLPDTGIAACYVHCSEVRPCRRS